MLDVLNIVVQPTKISLFFYNPISFRYFALVKQTNIKRKKKRLVIANQNKQIYKTLTLQLYIYKQY